MRLLICFCLIQLISYGQEEADSITISDTIHVIEFGGPEPEFVGGMDSLVAFVNRHLEYPTEALNQKIEGRVIVRFLVKGDGSLSEVHVVRSVHPLLDAEAMRLISIMPNWKPLYHHDQPHQMWATLPIQFSLSSEK